MTNEVNSLPLSEIKTKNNSRLNHSREGDLSDLMLSIKNHGVLEPVGVKKSGDHYDLIFGFRRYFASKKLGNKTIPARVVLTENAKESDAILLNITENLVRANPTIAEQSIAFKKLRDNGMTPAEISIRLGVPRKRVKAYLSAMRTMPNDLRKDVQYVAPGNRAGKGKIPGGVINLVENARKSLGLTRSQCRLVYEASRGEDATVKHVQSALVAVRSGVALKKALAEAANFQQFAVNLNMNKTEQRKIENKTGKKMGRIITNLLAEKYPGLVFQ